MALRPPYVRRLDTRHGVEVWQVSGHWIRDHLDVEFTNGHHHYTRSYVPKHEIWLDGEAKGADEWPLWAERQRRERELMQEGAPYLSALRIAGRSEVSRRRLLLQVVVHPTVSALREHALRRQIDVVNGRAVWLVSGRCVRDRAYVDFTLGGHGYRYRFISRREIWLDDAVRPSERGAILHHEAVEVAHMSAGMPYPQAHALASHAEVQFRRRRLRARSTT
jgi:hypothetical protein